MVLEASVLCGDRDMAEALVNRLAPLASRIHGNYPIVSYGRLLGEAAAMLGQWDRARDFYSQVMRICERIRFRPELALTQPNLAELLYAHFPEAQSEALVHLGIVTEELRARGMQPGLERALQPGNSSVALNTLAHPNATTRSRVAAWLHISAPNCRLETDEVTSPASSAGLMTAHMHHLTPTTQPLKPTSPHSRAHTSPHSPSRWSRGRRSRLGRSR